VKINNGFKTAMKHRYTLFLTFIFIVLTGSATAENLDTGLLHSLGEVKYHELQSCTLKRAFHIFVDLPKDYAESGETYPTIYLLDGDITFPLMAGYHHYLRSDNETPAAILVGISYGAETFEEGNKRSTDYTAPTDEREYWGGAANFQIMLSDELMPLIENTYRSDPTRRVIFGQSIGGQFVLFTAFTRPELFHGHIASNPALHRNLPFFLEWHSDKKTPANSRVYVSSGELDDPRFREPALKWIDYWQNQDSRPWALKTQTLAGQTHFSAAPEAFRQGLAWSFSEDQNP
jgi:predicted alpha/beta superfamily hydrolase